MASGAGAMSTAPELLDEVSKLRRQLEATRRELDDARRRLDEPPELRGHSTWGVSELARALFDAHTTGQVCPTDLLVVLCLYSMCIWPAEAAPPEAASTPPISYDFLAAKVALRRSGIEKAIGRLRERGWVATERDPETGYLTYTVEVGRMLDDLADWGSWSTKDAKDARPPSRRSSVQRSERWQGRSPALPASPRSRPRSSEAGRLIREWRRRWARTADPTAVINRLLGEGVPEAEIRRAMHSMDYMGRPRPDFLADRVARTDYQRPRLPPDAGEPDASAEDDGALEDPPTGPASPVDPGAGSSAAPPGGPEALDRPELLSDGVLEAEEDAERPPDDEPDPEPEAPTSAPPVEPEAPDDGRLSDAERARAGRRFRQAFAGLLGADGDAPAGLESRPPGAARPSGGRSNKSAKPPDRNEKWTDTAIGNTTRAGHAQERARAPDSESRPPSGTEGEL